jgi:hypothetical protein
MAPQVHVDSGNTPFLVIWSRRSSPGVGVFSLTRLSASTIEAKACGSTILNVSDSYVDCRFNTDDLIASLSEVSKFEERNFRSDIYTRLYRSERARITVRRMT